MSDSFARTFGIRGIRYPIIQAPMAGVSTPELAAEVSLAGGLGSLGLGASTIEEARRLIQRTRERTDKPFNVNFFCHQPANADTACESAWLEYLSEHFRKLGGVPPSSLKEPYPTSLGNRDMLAMLLEERPPVVSFHFGIPAVDWIKALHDADILLMASATNLDEARQVEEAGIDVLIAQGYEAGGHRGAFDPQRDERIGTLPLVRMLACQTSIPVVAAGGIMDGKGIAATLLLGASAVQLGTAFLLCPEAATSEAYRNDLKSNRAAHTEVTSAISGRPARGIKNRMYQLAANNAPSVPDYPIAYCAGKALHQLAASQGSSDYAAHWAGQGVLQIRELPAAVLMRELVAEWQSCKTYESFSRIES